MAGYSISIKASATKELEAISDKATLNRLIEKIKSLATQPRPSGSEKLASRPNLSMISRASSTLLRSATDEMSYALQQGCLLSIWLLYDGLEISKVTRRDEAESDW